MIERQMRGGHRVTACVALALFSCGGTFSPAVDTCVVITTSPTALSPDAATDVCNLAWLGTGDERAASGAAYAANAHGDDPTLATWAALAPESLEGAKILHFWGERQRSVGDLAHAEQTLRR